jgi:phytanoyl-CoA hydroxylase
MQTSTTLRDTVKPLTLHENEVRFHQAEGYLCLPGLISPADAEAARAETLEILRISMALRPEDATGRSGKTQKLIQSGQYLRGSTLDSIVNSPSLLRIAAQLLGGPSTLYLPFTAVKTGGGGGRFAFHQDNQYTRFVDGLGGINIWFALCDMTPDNGCLQICPRSHLRGTLEADTEADGHRRVKIEPKDFLPIRMRAGDAVAFSRLTVHGSGENITSEPRVGYAVQFHRDDVMAIWDNQPPRPLKNAGRWSTGPVDKISAPTEASRDGH